MDSANSPNISPNAVPSTCPEYVSLSLSDLVENPWNPNQMDGEQFGELVQEVTRLGTVLKPIVVRQDGDHYQIVDGCHSYRAAVQAGLSEVPCQIVDADDFEAMRQTYCRNQHGKHNHLLEGLMFEEMIRLKGLTQRALATEFGISDGTVRNSLEYVDALRSRNDYAGEDRSDEIAQLTIKQVRTFTNLGRVIGNKWLDAGGDLRLLTAFRNREEWAIPSGHYDEVDIENVFEPIEEAGWVEFLEGVRGRFVVSTKRLLAILCWRRKHAGINQAEEYALAVAESGGSVDVLALLPCTSDGMSTAPALSPDRWREVLAEAREQADPSSADFATAVEKAVLVALEQEGIPLDTVFEPRVAAKIEALRTAPEFIRDAAHLTVRERAELASCTAHGATSDQIERAQRLTCERLVAQFAPSRRSKVPRIPSIQLEFSKGLKEIQRDDERATVEAAFQDPEAIRECLIDTFADAPAIKTGMVEDRPAADVLRTRFATLEFPEIAAIAAFALQNPNAVADAMTRWLAGMNNIVGSVEASPPQ